MSINLAGLPLQSPLIAASGTCGYVGELRRVTDFNALGAIVTKSITPKPREGNQTWRIIDLPAGMLNAIGLANVGIDRFMSETIEEARDAPTTIIGSIAGGSIDDYVMVAKAFDASDVLPAVELNVSCPNTDDGLVFGEDPVRLGELLREVRSALRCTKMIVKLSPNVSDVRPLARAAIDAGADALTIANTITAMAIGVETRAPRLSNVVGGLSGPAVHPIAVRMVHQVYRDAARDAGVPIIGLGGVLHWRDAAEFILAGASAVGIGTALFANPNVPTKVLRGLTKWVERQGATSITDLVGEVRLS